MRGVLEDRVETRIGYGRDERDLPPVTLEGNVSFHIVSKSSIRVAKLRTSTSCQNTVISILYPDKMDNTDAIKYEILTVLWF